MEVCVKGTGANQSLFTGKYKMLCFLCGLQDALMQDTAFLSAFTAFENI